MNKRQAKQKAWRDAAAWLETLLNSGYPYQMIDDVDPGESEKDLERIHDAMQEIVDHCWSGSKHRDR